MSPAPTSHVLFMIPYTNWFFLPGRLTTACAEKSMVSLSELGMFSIEFLWCHPLALSMGTVAAKDRRRWGGSRAHTRESERRRRREGGMMEADSLLRR